MTKKKFKISLVLIFLMALLPTFFVWAQDGTSGGTSGGTSDIKDESVEIPLKEMPTETPTEAGPQTIESTPPEEATSRGTSVSPAPIPDDPAPTDTNNMEAEPISPSAEEPEQAEKKPKSNLFIFLAVATAMLFAVLGGILKVKKAQDKKYEKKDDSRCFNIKKMMEDKLNEATDLRGKIESAAKDKARGVVRNSIENTPLADIMVTAERAEKEYNRLKKLYEQCVIEIEKKELHMPISIKGIIFENGKVWLRKNARGEWELPGGKLDEGEQPKQTLTREIKEELGFDVDVQEAVDSYVYEIKREELKVFVVGYICSILQKSGEFEIAEEAKGAEFRSFTPEEIANLNMPDFYKDMIMKSRGLPKQE